MRPKGSAGELERRRLLAIALLDKGHARLERLLLKGAKAAGYQSNLWTCPRIAEVIAEYFEVVYHPDPIGRLLRSLGWSPQRPQRRALERDEERIRGWIREGWPRSTRP
jgi:transposase